MFWAARGHTTGDELHERRVVQDQLVAELAVAIVLVLPPQFGRSRSSAHRSSGDFTPRMRALEDMSQPFPADVGVDLGRGQVGVAEKLLHGTEVGAAVEQVGGERVPQRVRMRRSRGSPVQDAPDVSRRRAHGHGG